jgi:hypothetical protein
MAYLRFRVMVIHLSAVSLLTDRRQPRVISARSPRSLSMLRHSFKDFWSKLCAAEKISREYLRRFSQPISISNCTQANCRLRIWSTNINSQTSLKIASTFGVTHPLRKHGVIRGPNWTLENVSDFVLNQ